MLREADRTSVAEVARKHKVTEQTIYSWRRKFHAGADIKGHQHQPTVTDQPPFPNPSKYAPQKPSISFLCPAYSARL